MTTKSSRNLILFSAVVICGAIACFCSGCGGQVQYINGPHSQAMKAKANPAPLPSPLSLTEETFPNDPELTASTVKALAGHPEDARAYHGLFRAYFLNLVTGDDGKTTTKLKWTDRGDMERDFNNARDIAGLDKGKYHELSGLVKAHLGPLSGDGDVTSGWLADCKTRFGQLAFACREAAK